VGGSQCTGVPRSDWDAGQGGTTSAPWEGCNPGIKARDDIAPWDQRKRLVQQSSDAIVLCGRTDS
jgi:hypothetical protein